MNVATGMYANYPGAWSRSDALEGGVVLEELASSNVVYLLILRIISTN